jgi:CDGSH-type Zn-finger protein
MENGKEKIRILKNGPYAVTGSVPLDIQYIVPDEDGNGESYKKVKEYEPGGSYSLCRCGHTHKSPFCDGTHQKIDFTAPEVANRACYCERARVYEGGTIDLLDVPELCALARYCDRFGNTWRLTIDSSEEHPENEERAIYEANHCPSGRLTMRKNGVEIEPELQREISLLEDIYYETKGPIYVKGGVTLADENGCEYEIRNRRTLCRCGGSQNMPFCDGTHLRCEHMKGTDV